MLIYNLNIFKYAPYRHKLVYVFIYTNKQDTYANLCNL